MPAVDIGRPQADEYAPFYADYVARAGDADLLEALAGQVAAIEAAFAAVPPSHHGYRYAPGKWTVRELASHLIDGERVFSYRALRFARGDETPLPGFEEDLYVAHGEAEARQLSDLVAEFSLLRRANVIFYGALSAAAWRRRGVASDHVMSVRALATVSVGHLRHHLETLRNRYAGAW
jgi:hypothetical protein